MPVRIRPGTLAPGSSDLAALAGAHGCGFAIVRRMVRFDTGYRLCNHGYSTGYSTL